MRINIYITTIFITFSILISCTDEHKIGEIKVDGLNDVKVRLTQNNEFDSSTGVYYEIIYKNDSVLINKSLLMGSLDYINDSTHFKARAYNSIIYITYYNLKDVYALYDLSSGKGFPRGRNDDNIDIEVKFQIADSLFKIIKSNNYDLTTNWKN